MVRPTLGVDVTPPAELEIVHVKPRTHFLDDPCSDTLAVPSVAVIRSSGWNGENYSPSFPVKQIGVGQTEVIYRYAISDLVSAVQAARHLVLLDGIHGGDPIACIEDGILAGIAWQRSREEVA